MADNAETASSSEAGFRQRIVEFPGDNDESTVGTLDIALPSPRPENMSAAGGGEEAADDPPSLVVIEVKWISIPTCVPLLILYKGLPSFLNVNGDMSSSHSVHTLQRAGSCLCPLYLVLIPVLIQRGLLRIRVATSTLG